MINSLPRRRFLHCAAAASASIALGGNGYAQGEKAGKLFDISLAQWSLNRQFFAFLGNKRGKDIQLKIDPMDFAKYSKEEFGIEAVEYVNQFYVESVRNSRYLKDLKNRSADQGVRNVLIMCDGEGDLGDPDSNRRITSVRNHVKWLEWAKELGCHSIRVNARSDGKLGYHAQKELAVDGLRRLSEIGDTYDLNVIVENHGGLSSHGRWLADVMEMVDHPRCGTLPDFGNFRDVTRGVPEGKETGPTSGTLDYDPYLGTYELMPFAKGASAKTSSFDDDGNESTLDYMRLMNIVLDPKFNFSGYVGVEYEGGVDAVNGIKKTKALLERVRDELA